MASGSLGNLVISLEANIARFTSDMGRAANQTEQTMNRMDRASAQTQRAMSSLQNTASVAGVAIAGVMAGLSVQKLIQYSDSWTNIESRIKLVTTTSRELASVQGQLFDIAQRNRSDMSATVALYTRLAQSADTLGASQKDMIKFTEGVSAAVLISGSGTAEAAGAMQQLSQAMSNANIMAQEYNSINDGAPEILRAVARNIQGVDGDLGKLRQKMLAGGLSSKEFFAAFLKDTDSLAEKSQGMALTVAQAYTKLNNEAMKFVGEASKASGSGQMLAGTIDSLSKNLDTLSAAVGGLVAYKMSEWTLLIASALVTKANAAYTTAGALATERFATIAAAEASVVSTAATVAQAEAKAVFIAELRVETMATLARTNAVIQTTVSDAASTLAMQSRAVAMAELAALGQAQVANQAKITAANAAAAAAQTRLNAANAAGAGAAGLASRALGFLGGPIGAVTTVLGLGAAAWLFWGNSAKDSEAKAAGAVEASTDDIIADLDAQIKKLQQRNGLANSGLKALAQSGTAEADRMAALRAQMGDVSSGKGEYAGLNDAARSDILAKLGTQYGTLYARIQTVNVEKGKLASSDDAASTTKWMTEYATKAEKLAAKLKEIRASYKDGIIPPEVERRARAALEEKSPKPKAPKKTEVDKLDDDSKALVAKLKDEEASYGLTGAALLSYKMTMAGMSDEYKQQALASQTTIDALQAEDEATKKRAADQQKMADEAARATQQNEANVEQIRQSMLTDVAREQEGHQIRLEELQLFHDAKLENVIAANALIEAENARHEQAKAAMQMQFSQQAVGMAGDSAAQLYSVLQAAGMEQTALGKALFIANKAIAVAEIIMNTEVAAAKALTMGPIIGPPLAMVIRGLGYASAGIVIGTTIASAEGGYDIPAGTNPVTQLHEKEMVLPRAQADVIRNLASQRGTGGNAPAINQTLHINIDGTTDMARNEQLVRSAVQQGNAELVDRLQRAGRI